MVQKINMCLNNRSSRKPRQTQPTTVNNKASTPNMVNNKQPINHPTTNNNRFNLSTIYNSTRKSCG